MGRKEGLDLALASNLATSSGRAGFGFPPSNSCKYMHLSPLVHPPDDAKYAHCFGIFPGLLTPAFGEGVTGLLEEDDASVEPIEGPDFGTDSPALPLGYRRLSLLPFFDSPPLLLVNGGGVGERSPFFPLPLPLPPFGNAGPFPFDFPLPLTGVVSPLVIAFTVFSCLFLGRLNSLLRFTPCSFATILLKNKSVSSSEIALASLMQNRKVHHVQLAE